MRGKSLPQIGVVEINVIEEDVTRLLDRLEQGGLVTRLRDDGAV